MTPFLSVRGLSASYVSRPWGVFGKREARHVLDGVDLEIGRGEIFGLVGESGCGKTTLAKCILGLNDYEGEIVINDRMRGKKPSFRERRKAAYEVQGVFQDPGSSLNPVKSVGWILEEPLRVHSLPLVQGLSGHGRRYSAAERLIEVDTMLDRVGLDSSYKKRMPEELSTGQKQRVAIGAALMLRPGLLVADEPVSSLDVSVGAQILNLFRELNQRMGLALLFISHNPDQVDYLCDRVAIMQYGKILPV